SRRSRNPTSNDSRSKASSAASGVLTAVAEQPNPSRHTVRVCRMFFSSSMMRTRRAVGRGDAIAMGCRGFARSSMARALGAACNLQDCTSYPIADCNPAVLRLILAVDRAIDERGLAMSLTQRIFGKPRDLRDPHLFHRVALIAFFAWVGLGADGLS